MRMKTKTIIAAVAAALRSYRARGGLALGALALSVDKEAFGKLPKEQQSLYAEKDGRYVLEVDGIEDTGGLKSALEKEREARKAADKALKALQTQWEGLDAAQVKALVEKLGGDEEAQLIKAGKIDEVLARRMEKANKANEKALAAASDEVKKAQERAAKFSQRVLDNAVREAGTKAGIHANAIEDALFRARSMFTLDEDGQVVQLDKDGQVVLGKDSKTPFGPGEWLEGMKESAPHWFPAGSTGGGAAGSKGAGGTRTIKRADFNKQDPASQAATAKEAREGKIQIVD